MNDTTPAITTKTGDNPSDLLAPDNTSCSLYLIEQLSLFGENSKTQAANPELTARFFATSPKYSHLPLSVRLTPLLIARGLAKGTTRTFAARLYSLGIRGFVSYAPDGSVAEKPRLTNC